jgi:hypothetical protein
MKIIKTARQIKETGQSVEAFVPRATQSQMIAMTRSNESSSV